MDFQKLIVGERHWEYRISKGHVKVRSYDGLIDMCLSQGEIKGLTRNPRKNTGHRRDDNVALGDIIRFIESIS